MAQQPDLTADIDRWSRETLALLDKIGDLPLGPGGYCSKDLSGIVIIACALADDRRRIEAVLAERSEP